jgi:hypothetical protein
MTDKYEAPKVVRLDNRSRASAACTSGFTPTFTEACYRGNGFADVCVTGQSPAGACHEGI